MRPLVGLFMLGLPRSLGRSPYRGYNNEAATRSHFKLGFIPIGIFHIAQALQSGYFLAKVMPIQ